MGEGEGLGVHLVGDSISVTKVWFVWLQERALLHIDSMFIRI